MSSGDQTGYNIFYHDAYHEWDDFRQEYQESFGKKPYVGPHVRYLWYFCICLRGLSSVLLNASRKLGADISAQERSQAAHELEVYRDWIASSVFPTTLDAKSSAIIVLPVGSTEPDYRDVLSGPFQARLGVDEITFGSWLGVPELVLPGIKENHSLCVFTDSSS